MALEDLFTRGIDAWKDIEVAKRYAANDPRPATRASDGTAIPQGTPGTGSFGAILQSTTVKTIVIALVAGAVVYIVAKRL